MGFLDLVKTAVANGRANAAAREQRYRKHVESSAKAGRRARGFDTWAASDRKRQRTAKTKAYWKDRGAEALTSETAMKRYRRDVAVSDFFSSVLKPKRRRGGRRRKSTGAFPW
jgi:hypothetical protein